MVLGFIKQLVCRHEWTEVEKGELYHLSAVNLIEHVPSIKRICGKCGKEEVLVTINGRGDKELWRDPCDYQGHGKPQRGI